MRKKVKYIIFSLLVISVKLNAQNSYEQALKLYHNDDNLKAIELFTEAIKSNDHKALSYLYRGRCKFDTNNNDYINDYKESIKLDPKNFKAYQFLATSYLLSNELEQARLNFKKALELNNKDAPSLQGLSLVALAKQDIDNALKFINEAINIDSNDYEDFFSNRGYIMMILGRYNEAILDCEKSISILPNIQAYSNGAACYFKIKNYEKSLQFSIKALEMDDRLVDMRVNNILCYEKLNKLDLACAEYKKVVAQGITLDNDVFKSKCDK